MKPEPLVALLAVTGSAVAAPWGLSTLETKELSRGRGLKVHRSENIVLPEKRDGKLEDPFSVEVEVEVEVEGLP
jgi:hypothetical protein